MRSSSGWTNGAMRHRWCCKGSICASRTCSPITASRCVRCRGRGALRGWLDVEGGRVTGITADLGLRDVVTRLAEDVPEMILLDLRGRAAWKEEAGGMEVSTERLAMRLQNGVELQPTDFYFRTAKAARGS